jgi:hypothetical protein
VTNYATNDNSDDDFVIGTAIYAISGNVLECDIRMRIDLPDGLDWGSGSSLDNNEIDIESVLLHEIGHCIGLSHDSVEEAVMHASIAVGSTDKRSLAPSDIGYAKEIYGEANAATTTTKAATTTTKAATTTTKAVTTTKASTTTVAGATTLDNSGCPAKSSNKDCKKQSCSNGLVPTYFKSVSTGP